MIVYSYGLKINIEKAKIIIDTIKKIFCDNIDSTNNLIWNSFKLKPKLMTFDLVKLLNVPKYSKLYFYLERQNEAYITTYEDICRFIDELEIWEEIDGYVFDNSYKWIIVITHEDKQSLVLGF